MKSDRPPRSVLSPRLIACGDSTLDVLVDHCKATCRLPGATAYGLLNNNSITHAREAFSSFFASFPSDIPLIYLGAVDCSRLIWRKKEVEPKELIKNCVQNLFSFLSELNRKFIVVSVTYSPVDAVKDYPKHSWEVVSQQEMTDHIKLFNTYLKEGTETFGHYYLDITTPTTGPDGLIDPKHVRSNRDLHLIPWSLYYIVKEALDNAQDFWSDK